MTPSRTASMAAPALLAAFLLVAPGAPLAAQTDYLNLDAGRPLRVEDAHSLEWRAVEVQLAPLSLERAAAGRYAWGIEPELAIGILPRTHVSFGVPIASIDAPGAGTTGVAGLHAGIFHQLNVETRIPAIAVMADVLLPVGSLGPSRAWPTVGAVVTRTLSALGAVRVHGMGKYTIGDLDTIDPLPAGSEAASPGDDEIARWVAGVAVDRTFPLHFTTVGLEFVAVRGLADEADVAWQTGLGIRRQLTPRFVFDAGVARRMTGDVAPWSFTIGSAYAFGLGGRPF